MIAAASADGHINNAEKAELKSHIAAMNLSEELLDDIKNMIENPSSWQEIVDLVTSEAEASEVYLATRLFIHKHSSQQEQDYLNNLVAGLKLDSSLIDELDKQLES